MTPQLIVADANAEFLLLRGLPREQLVGSFLPEDCPENDSAEPFLLRVLASLRRAVDTGERSVSLRCSVSTWRTTTSPGYGTSGIST